MTWVPAVMLGYIARRATASSMHRELDIGLSSGRLGPAARPPEESRA